MRLIVLCILSILRTVRLNYRFRSTEANSSLLDEMDSAVDYYLEKGYIRPECGDHNRNHHTYIKKTNI